MEFTQVPADLMQEFQINAGIVCDEFDPSTRAYGNILAATGGGVDFDPKPSYKDYGEGVDNLPPNTWQLKRVTHFEPHLTGTFKSVTAALAKKLQAGSSFASGSTTHIVPGSELTEADFYDCWLVGDYSDVNTGASAGFIAIHLKNAMNVLGFRLKTNDEDKGDISFDFQGHYDLDDIDEVPFEFWVEKGTAASTSSQGTSSSSQGTSSSSQGTSSSSQGTP